MPTKVSVGLSRKAGLPNYGSIGASCHVELELDAKILESDPERFRLQVKRAYAACRDSVESELAHRLPVSATRTIASDCGHETMRPYRKRQRTASPGQLRVIERIAERRQMDLQPLLQRLGVSEARQLSVVAASDLIAELQECAAAD